MVHDFYFEISLWSPALLLTLIAIGIATGIVVHSRAPACSCQVGRGCLSLLACGLLVLFLTAKTKSQIHGTCASALLCLTCVTQSFVVVVLFRQTKGRPSSRIVALGAAFLVYPLMLLGFFTGGLAPNNATDFLEETSNRFTVLHCGAIPIFIALLCTVCWFWLDPKHAVLGDSKVSVGLPSTDENPYQSPGTN